MILKQYVNGCGLVRLTFLMRLCSADYCESADKLASKDGHCQSMSNEELKIEGTDKMSLNNELAVVLYDESSVFPIHQRERKFRYCGRELVIKQDWSGLGVAAVVWDAAEVLADYLEKSAEIIKDKRVIELGAGTGLVGMVAALLGAKITITDRKEVLAYLETSVQTNLPHNVYQSINIEPLDWCKDLHKFQSTYDVILGADIVYIEEVFEDLLKTLQQLSNKETLILLSCRIRYDRDTNFLKRLEDHFDVLTLLYDKEKDVNLYKVTKK